MNQPLITIKDDQNLSWIKMSVKNDGNHISISKKLLYDYNPKHQCR